MDKKLAGVILDVYIWRYGKDAHITTIPLTVRRLVAWLAFRHDPEYKRITGATA